MTTLKRTPLYDRHVAAGGRVVPFAGWELPVQYEGLVAEHQAVRSAVGIFDVSHMGELVLHGPEAATALQWVVTNDVARLADGDAQYTVMCRDDGGIIDDLIVYREAPNRYFLIVNASRIDADFDHISANAANFDCVLENQSDNWGLLAVQGPRAFELLNALGVDGVAEQGSFTFVDRRVGGVEGVRVARTGYTGEDGVELAVPAKDVVALWDVLFAAGKPFGLVPCGLGARDTLRLEMKYPLYGQDIDLEHNPIEAGLGWVVKLDKGQFVGRDALRAVKEQGVRRKLVGFRMTGRGVPRHDYPLCVEGKQLGVVTSGTHSPSLGVGIGMGYLPKAQSRVGTDIHVEIRGKSIAAKVVKTPFYKREES